MRRAVILVAWLIAFSGVAAAATITIDIQAFIDGRSLLIFQGDTVQWHNLDYNAPGRWDGNRPTIFDTALNGVPQWTDYNWYPDWPGGAYGRRLVVDPGVNDDPIGGAAWYEGQLTITYTEAGGVPEPSSWLLLGSGLLAGLALLHPRRP